MGPEMIFLLTDLKILACRFVIDRNPEFCRKRGIVHIENIEPWMSMMDILGYPKPHQLVIESHEAQPGWFLTQEFDARVAQPAWRV